VATLASDKAKFSIQHDDASTQQERLLTAEEYFATCHRDDTELIDGKVKEVAPPGFDHGDVAGEIYSQLKRFARQQGLGRVSVEGGLRLQRNPDTVRAPDVSFVESARLEGISTRGFIEGAPTLAVEVVSPGDTWSEVESKTRLYLEAGAKEVWIVEIESRTVEVRRSGEASHIYLQSETLQSAVLPGFELKISEIFE
jgi:Uma2 family endonuclease